MKEGVTQPSPEGETDNKIRRWGYDTRFKYYLLRAAILGNEGVESIRNFPEEIELDDTWHKTLDQMREESHDGVERGIPIGYREDRRNVYLPQEFLLGTRTKARIPTPYEAKEKFGITHQLGVIHSHRNDRLSRFAWKALAAAKMEEGTGFSLGDIYYMVDGYGLPMEAVVEKDRNYFAFRTQETKDIPVDSPLSSKEAFERYWYRKHGVKPVFDSNIVVITKFPFSIRQMNIGLAEAYNLAFYSGKPGEDLVRQYP